MKRVKLREIYTDKALFLSAVCLFDILLCLFDRALCGWLGRSGLFGSFCFFCLSRSKDSSGIAEESFCRSDDKGREASGNES